MIKTYWSSNFAKYFFRVLFWAITLSGLYGAIFHHLKFLYIIFPILDLWLFGFSFLFVIKLYVEGDHFVKCYDLLGFKEIKRYKKLDNIETISLKTFRNNGGIRSTITIAYKRTKRQSYPTNTIQVALKSNHNIEPNLDFLLTLEPSLASKQLVCDLYQALKQRGHELKTQHVYLRNKNSSFEIGINKEPLNEESYQSIADVL